jgi:CRP/FNR family transcriptional regulator, nitrogen fixation regulation protein
MEATIQTTRQSHGDPDCSIRQPATPDALDLLEQFGATMVVEREHEIHGQGDTAEYCWRILSGCVRTVKLMEDGRRQVADFLFPGDLLGLDDLGTHDFSAEAVTEVTLRRYPRRMVEALADSHAALARRLRALALANLRSAHEQMVMLGRKTAVEKVGWFVLEMEHRATPRGQKVTEVPMSRADIADHLGLTVETVCRILAHMKREGVVRLHRIGIEILDRRMLRALASEARH